MFVIVTVTFYTCGTKYLLNFLFSDILNVHMAGCLDFRQRTTSFDLHDIGQAQKSSLLAKLFRSKSDSSMKGKRSPGASPGSSPKGSPKPSPGQKRQRRFVRVIKNDDHKGEEYITGGANPHVVRKYTKGFWDKKKSSSLDDPTKGSVLPYEVPENTIMKKSYSMDSPHTQSPCATPPATHMIKSCKFKEEVDILEYDIKEKCKDVMTDAHISHEKLHVSVEPEYCIDMDLFEHTDGLNEKCPLKIALRPSDILEANSKLEALEVIDEKSILRTDDSSDSELCDIEETDDDSSEIPVFYAQSDEDTDSATESCDDLGHEKKEKEESPSKSSDKKEVSRKSTGTSPPLRQTSDEGLSAPKKSKTSLHTAKVGRLSPLEGSLIAVEQ